MRSILSVSIVLFGFLMVYIYALPVAYAIPDDGNRGYSQSSYANSSGSPDDRDERNNYSQSSYSSTGIHSSAGNGDGGSDSSDSDGGSGYSNYVPQVIRSVANTIWSSVAKPTIDTATKVFEAATAVVTRNTERVTYTSLPSGDYLSSDGRVTQTQEPRYIIKTPTTADIKDADLDPVPASIQAQIDAIAAQQARTGVITSALTPTQKAILERAKIELGADINNPAVESAILLATKGQTVADALTRLKEIETSTGGTITRAAVNIAFGRYYGSSCTDAGCAAANKLAEYAGIGAGATAQSALEVQMQGVDQRKRAEVAAQTASQVTSPTSDATKAAQEKARQAEMARLLEINSPVGGGISKVPGAIEAIVKADAEIDKAQLELEKARVAAVGAAIDSQQMFTYADALRRQNLAKEALQSVITAAQNNETVVIEAEAKRISNLTEGVKILSESITDTSITRLEPGSGTGIVQTKSREEAQREAINYLWENYQQTDFSWKDENAAKKAGMTMKEYVMGGIDPQFAIVVAAAGKAMEADGIDFEITSGFRDDYRQSLIEAGIHAVTGFSWHGGSQVTEGHGDGKAIDISSAEAQKWVDENGAKYGIARPYGAKDAPHIALASSPEALRRIGGIDQATVDKIEIDLRTSKSSQGDVFRDFEAYIAEQQNKNPEVTTPQTVPKTTQERVEETVRTVAKTALGFVTNPLGTALSIVSDLLGGPSTNNYTPSNDNDSPTKPTTPTAATPAPSTDLYSTATGATETGKETATSTEYKFGGSITRVIYEAEEGLKTTDINANYADTVTTSLSVDYQCDNTVDATSVTTTLYTAFDVTQDTSKVLLSLYVPVTEFGTHCFFITTDTQNVVKEKDESNNKSNVYRFIVGEL